MAGRASTPLLFETEEFSCRPTLEIENHYRDSANPYIAGVDEVGRGPLAGPVVAAAVVLPEEISLESPLHMVRDSKLLDVEKREHLYAAILGEAVSVSWAFCDHAEVDELNILAASLKAMSLAVADLNTPPALCLVDGNQPIPGKIPCVTVVKGDRKSMSIAAASIVAKVIRDGMMDGFNRVYPGYGFDLHKGYSTDLHRKALARLGPSPVHRRTFRGVKELI